MTENFLTNILDYKKALIKKNRDHYVSLKWNAQKCKRAHLFKNTLAEPGQIKLIAEIKKASPSRGIIRDDFDPAALAKAYEANKAAAISVVTEDKYFLGSPEFVKQVADAVNVPVLAKDFIIDDGQLYEALVYGAHAVLLIAAILDDTSLKGLLETSKELGLDCLVEVHNEKELKRACDAGAEIIGVNNRDLLVFVVDMQNCIRLIPKIPKDKIIVGESGFQKYSQVKAIKNLGAHGVLIGETFMREDNIGEKMREVLYGTG